MTEGIISRKSSGVKLNGRLDTYRVVGDRKINSGDFVTIDSNLTPMQLVDSDGTNISSNVLTSSYRACCAINDNRVLLLYTTHSYSSNDEAVYKTYASIVEVNDMTCSVVSTTLIRSATGYPPPLYIKIKKLTDDRFVLMLYDCKASGNYESSSKDSIEAAILKVSNNTVTVGSIFTFGDDLSSPGDSTHYDFDILGPNKFIVAARGWGGGIDAFVCTVNDMTITAGKTNFLFNPDHDSGYGWGNNIRVIALTERNVLVIHNAQNGGNYGYYTGVVVNGNTITAVTSPVNTIPKYLYWPTRAFKISGTRVCVLAVDYDNVLYACVMDFDGSAITFVSQTNIYTPISRYYSITFSAAMMANKQISIVLPSGTFDRGWRWEGEDENATSSSMSFGILVVNDDGTISIPSELTSEAYIVQESYSYGITAPDIYIALSGDRVFGCLTKCVYGTISTTDFAYIAQPRKCVKSFDGIHSDAVAKTLGYPGNQLKAYTAE